MPTRAKLTRHEQANRNDDFMTMLIVTVTDYTLYTVFRKKTPTYIFFHISMSDV